MFHFPLSSSTVQHRTARVTSTEASTASYSYVFCLLRKINTQRSTKYSGETTRLPSLARLTGLAFRLPRFHLRLLRLRLRLRLRRLRLRLIVQLCRFHIVQYDTAYRYNCTALARTLQYCTRLSNRIVVETTMTTWRRKHGSTRSKTTTLYRWD